MYLQLPKLICVRSLLPLKNAYEEVLQEISDYVLNERIWMLKQMKTINDDMLSILNAKTFNFETDLIMEKNDKACDLLMSLFETSFNDSVPPSIEFHQNARVLNLKVVLHSDYFSLLIFLFGAWRDIMQSSTCWIFSVRKK